MRQITSRPKPAPLLFTPKDLHLLSFWPLSMLYILVSPLMHFNIFNKREDQITKFTRLSGEKMADFSS